VVTITVIQTPTHFVAVGDVLDLQHVRFRVTAIEPLGPPEFLNAGGILIPHKVIATLERVEP
jgi:hypothetical protein